MLDLPSLAPTRFKLDTTQNVTDGIGTGLGRGA